MAADLRIEVFAVDLFRKLWYELGISNFVPPRLRRYDNITIPTNCVNAVFDVVICRRAFFAALLWPDIYFHYEDYSKSSFEFYLYLLNNMPKYLPYSELNIFDKLMMACIVVLEMANTCVLKTNDMYKYSAPKCLAMYFDIEHSEEFYYKGGWEGLEIHTNSYKATCNREIIENCAKSPKFAFNDSIGMEYLDNLITQYFKEKLKRCKVFCPQCLPLFHVVSMLSGTIDELINEFQLTEGYLQLLLRMLSKEELEEREQEILKDTKFETFSDIVDIHNAYMEKENDEDNQEVKKTYQEILGYLKQYRIQNTFDFLSRLFPRNGNSTRECMFCNRNLEKLSRSSVIENDYVKRINSAIKDTINNVKVKDFKVNKNIGKDDDINKTLKLFLSLGTQPLTSEIGAILREKTKPNKSFGERSAQNAEQCGGMKENKSKKKQKKKKNKE